MAKVRVSGVQLAVSTKLEENIGRILGYIKRSDAEFILFPEMSLTGYHGDFDEHDTRGAWNEIALACREARVNALVGTGCKENGNAYIQVRIYSAKGKLAGTHEKMVPTDADRKFFQPGKELRVFKLNGVTFGCLICNDMWVTPGCGPYPDPRLCYQLGQRGAQIVFHAIYSGATQVAIPYHESNLVLRAMESKIHIVTANAAVSDGPVNARSGVVSPEGNWLVDCPRLDEHVYTQDIELAG
jgi:predicted amidohydrolase